MFGRSTRLARGEGVIGWEEGERLVDADESRSQSMLSVTPDLEEADD